MNTTTLKYGIGAVVLLGIGMLLGSFLFGGGSDAHDHGSSEASADAQTVWTCSMHPQIRQEEPGLCPICAMDLVPLDASGSADTPNMLEMTPSAVALANIRTVEVTRMSAEKTIRLSGKVVPDERQLSEMSARFGGRIERLFVSETGQRVRKGDPLAELYSPQFIAAQKELLEAASFRDSQPSLYNAAKQKLRFWDITEQQISEIEESGKVRSTVTIHAPQSGTVLKRMVDPGDYISEGSPLFEIADLGRVWIEFDAYESDLPWLREGTSVQFSTKAHPGKDFSARISFIDPVIDPQTRSATVRAELPNSSGQFKPQMLVSGTVEASLSRSGDDLVIPKSSLLWAGERAVVYVEHQAAEMPTFEYREITLGENAGDYYVVKDGLMEGERIVENGVFTIDAAAQLQGKTSLMNPDAGSTHEHEDSPKGALPNVGETHTGIPASFQKRLYSLYQTYYKVTESLVASDAGTTADAAKTLRKQLDALNAGLLPSNAQADWREVASAIREQSAKMADAGNIEQQRAGFAKLSNAMYRAVKEFGVQGKPIYFQYCPMALNDAGAYWLSDIKEIANPYFGDAMLKCGVVKETIK